MAETFRRGKIIDHTKRLISRKEIIASQLIQNEFSCMRDSLLGQVQCLDFIIHELIIEFDLKMNYKRTICIFFMSMKTTCIHMYTLTSNIF